MGDDTSSRTVRERARSVIDPISVPALVMRDGLCIAANTAYLRLVGIEEREIVGRSGLDLVAQRVAPADRRIVENAEALTDAEGNGHLWCRLRDANGHEMPERVVWCAGPHPGETLYFLFDATPEAFGRDSADALARAAGMLGTCATEEEVLERGCEVLAARNLTATVLLIVPGDPLLGYGPTRSPLAPSDRPFERARPPRAVLETINPAFSQRRAAFFQDGLRLVHDAYPEPLADEVARILPSQRMVQAPLFVDDEPFGALVVTGELLTPILAIAIELFAELLVRAIENVRLRRERVEHGRLTALREAAAVMAHEVRNPVAALLGAASLLERAQAHDREALARVIAEEATRLERLVEDLLTLGRPLTPRPCTVALEALADAACAILARRDHVDRARIEVTAPPSPMRVHADEDLLRLAVMNVVRNAAQCSKRTRVSFEERDAERAIVVEDEGEGFSEEAARRAGEPFFATRASDSGVGLAVVKRVLAANGGRLEVGPARALSGARVAMWLPREIG